MSQSHGLDDHPAHRPAGDVRSVCADSVEHREAVVGHIVDRVLGTTLQVARQPDVAVVEPHDMEAPSGEAVAELDLEVDALTAEAVDEQECRMGVGAEGLVVDGDVAIGGRGHG